MSEYIEAGGRCREALFLRRHRCVNYKGLGMRCKYCGASLVKLKKGERRKAGCRR